MSFRSSLSATLAAAAFAALAVLPASLSAQGAAGRWVIEYVGRMRIENGIQSGEKVKARLDLAQSGDSVTGTWAPLDGEGQVVKVRGVLQGNKLVLESDPIDARMVRNGEEEVIRISRTLDLTVDGASLSGELTQEAPGRMPRPPRAVTGKRE